MDRSSNGFDTPFAYYTLVGKDVSSSGEGMGKDQGFMAFFMECFKASPYPLVLI